ncbi:MAG: DUF2812 domain-containing protein [Lachnospiraceae bacterium]|nr:DUF2812 domain-containing protein [Lachnospiraceae bacterium]
MKDCKKISKDLNLYNRPGYERFFEEQAEEGWMLEGSNDIFWIFRRALPKKVRYSVTYLKDVTVFDPTLTDSQQTLNEFCERTGWEFVASSGSMQVFRTEKADPLPIETDPRLEIESYHASLKKGPLPLYLFFVFLSVLGIIINLFALFLTPIDLIRYGNRFIAVFAYGIAASILLFDLISYYVWRRRALKEAELTGTYHEAPKRQYAILLYDLFMLMGMAALLSCIGIRVWGIIGVALAIIVGSIGITLCISLFKKKKARARISKLVTVFLMIALLAGIVIPVISSVENAVRTERKPLVIYYQGMEQHIYADEIPLKVEDLIETDYDRYSYENYRSFSSFLGREYGARQDAQYGEWEDNPEVYYTVYELNFPFTRGLIAKTLLVNMKDCGEYRLPEGETEESWLSEDPEPWGAEKVYRMRNDDGTWWNQWLICYSDRIVFFVFDDMNEWTPTPEQMKTVTEKLS